jgi:hypothetical protein
MVDLGRGGWWIVKGKEEVRSSKEKMDGWMEIFSVSLCLCLFSCACLTPYCLIVK